MNSMPSGAHMTVVRYASSKVLDALPFVNLPFERTREIEVLSASSPIVSKMSGFFLSETCDLTTSLHLCREE